MKVAIFSTKSYDREYFDKFNVNYQHQLTYFECSLTVRTANLMIDFDAVCVFVNDKIDKDTIEILAKNGIKIIALRCAGFNNIDLLTAIEKKIEVVRVPSYSPNAVAEHAVALILTLSRKTHKAFNRIREGNFSLFCSRQCRVYGMDFQCRIIIIIHFVIIHTIVLFNIIITILFFSSGGSSISRSKSSSSGSSSSSSSSSKQR